MIKIKKNGFTLIEVIVTVAIIAIMAAVAIPRFSGYVTATDEKRAIMECRNAVQAGQLLFVDNYADKSLVTKTAIQEKAKLNGVVSSFQESDGTIIHLVVTTGKWTVTYCKDWESCSLHSKLYTTSKTGGSTTPVASEDYFYIGDTLDFKVSSLGNLATHDFGQWGSNVPEGSVFYWEGAFYYTRYNQYLTNSSDRSAYINNNLYAVKMNRSNFVTPSSTTKPGELKQTSNGVFVFFPNPVRYWEDYFAEGTWFKVNIN